MTAHSACSGSAGLSKHEGVELKDRLTVFIKEQLVKPQAAGLLADETVHILCAVVINGHSVLQRLDTGLQTEGDLGITDCVSVKRHMRNT